MSKVGCPECGCEDYYFWGKIIGGQIEIIYKSEVVVSETSSIEDTEGSYICEGCGHEFNEPAEIKEKSDG